MRTSTGVWDRGRAGQRAAFHRTRSGARDPPADRHGRCAVRSAFDAVAVGSADPVRHVAEGQAACARRRRACDCVVADHGHASGRRIIDYARFADAPTPCCRQPGGGRTALASRRRSTPCSPASPGCCAIWTWSRTHPALPRPSHSRQRFAEVTMVVTADDQRFRLRAALSRRRRDPAAQHADRARRRDGDPHAARRLPAGHAELATEPRPHGGATGAVHGGMSGLSLRLAWDRHLAEAGDDRRHLVDRRFAPPPRRCPWRRSPRRCRSAR